MKNGGYSIGISFSHTGTRTLRAYVTPGGPYSNVVDINVTR